MAINKAMRAALKALSYPDLDVKKNYKSLRSLKNVANLRPPQFTYRCWDHAVPCGDHQVPVRLFSPADGDRITGRPVLLFFHGGGWVTGNIDSYSRVCANMARMTGRLVVSVDYRLAPEHPFPAGLEDCYAVAREIMMDAALLQIRPQDVTVVGDSAGGNLAAAVSLLARDRGDFQVHRQILLYPATYNDHTAASPFPSVAENGDGYLLTSKRICDYMDLYARCAADRQNPYFAPLLAPDLSNQPRTLIITAQYDPLRDEGEAYGRRLAQAGNQAEVRRIDDALHGFFSLPLRFGQVQACYAIIQQFLEGSDCL